MITPDLVEERLVYFPFGAVQLAGVLAVPAHPNGRVVLLPWGAGAVPSSGRNRLRTRLARTITDQGFHSFRFDYQGVAESDGDYTPPDMARPYTGEILAAAAWLESQGLQRISIVANCFGAWSALMAASKIVGLEGLAMVNVPVRRDHDQARAGGAGWTWWARKLRRLTIRKLLKPDRRALYRKLVSAKASSLLGAGSQDTRFSRSVAQLLESGVPVLLMSGEDGFRADLESELDNGLRAAFEQAGSPTRLVAVSQRLGGWSSISAQDVLILEVRSWLHDLTESARTS